MGTRLQRRLRVGAALVAAAVLGLLLSADFPPGGGTESRAAQPALAQGVDWTDKVEGRLRVIGQAARTGRAQTAAENSQLNVATVNGQIRVVVEAAGGSRAGARGAAGLVQAHIEAEYADLVQMLVAPDRIPALATDPRVRYVRAPVAIGPRATAGEGVPSSGAAVWHNAGSTGTGVKVAIFDGGFTGLADRKAQGDIPQSAQLIDVCGGNVNATQHGTGVAEVVHEMAPGAELLLYCVGTEVQLGQAKDMAKAAGAHIISMSLSFFNSSRGDGNGPPSSPEGIVADARQSGILWVNSAGNAAAGEAWNGAWNDPDNDGFLDWVNGDRTNSMTIGANAQVCGYLRWDAWPTTAQDFALEVRDPVDFNTVLTPGTDNQQNGTQAPVEQVCYTNTVAGERQIDWVIRRVNATAPFPPRFDLNVFNQRLEHFKVDGNIDLPATSGSAVAVGAVCWQSERLEDYSSRGPTIDGRIKPDISAQSVVSGGAYGAWQACPADADGNGGFNGTSAAAPHLAGAAALVKGANPTFGPADIQAFLEGRARDKGAAGRDNQFGIGLLTLGAAPATTPPLPAGASAITLNVTPDGANRLRVVMTAFPGQTLQSLSWTLPANAAAETLDGASLPTGINLPAGTTSATFRLRRTSGSTVTLPILVRGSFGEWRTFVGGGTNAW